MEPKMTETRTVHDPFMGRDVQISNRLTDRLRGKYASGPHLPNGNPEFGWKQFEAPPIQHEAADRIEALEECRDVLSEIMRDPRGRGIDPDHRTRAYAALGRAAQSYRSERKANGL
jgi:hypothetical protein